MYKYTYTYQSAGAGGQKGITKSISLPKLQNCVGCQVASGSDTGTVYESPTYAHLQIIPTSPALQQFPNETSVYNPRIEIDILNPVGFWTPIELQKFDLKIEMQISSSSTYWCSVTLFFES